MTGGQFRPRSTNKARALRKEMPPAERLLWKALRNHQLAGVRFTRQYQTGPYFADFACRQHKVVVELDGYSHDMRQTHDAERDRFMAGQGWRVLRFGNEDVMGNLEGVVTLINAVCSDQPSLCPSRKREGGR